MKQPLHIFVFILCKSFFFSLVTTIIGKRQERRQKPSGKKNTFGGQSKVFDLLHWAGTSGHSEG